MHSNRKDMQRNEICAYVHTWQLTMYILTRLYVSTKCHSYLIGAFFEAFVTDRYLEQASYHLFLRLIRTTYLLSLADRLST